MRVVLLVALAVLLAGCTGASRLDRLQGGTSADALAPYYREYRDTVTAQYDHTYNVTIDEHSTELSVILNLTARSGGLTGSDAPTPAKLTLDVLSPDGKHLGNVTVDAKHPDARLVVRDFTMNGEHALRLVGAGVSTPTGVTTDVGASYLLSVEVQRG